MRILGLSRRMLRLGRRIARCEDGTVLIYVSIALTVFMGFAALVIDGGRLFTLDTELQSHADALALAGAAELDGNAGARTRADAAMNNLVQNSQTFGTGAHAITGYTRRFLDELPANDADPITNDFLAADDLTARFVEVTVTTRNISTTFARAIGGGQTAGTSAVAVAGFTSAVCKFTPLFMCNPYESPAAFWSNVGTTAEKRKVLALKQSNGGEDDPKYGPGNFGFLGSIDNATSFKESLARTDPGACFEQTGVDTEPGNKVSARTALNTRFDLYDGSFNSHKNDAEFRPARNVTKGYTGKNCNQAPVTPPAAMGFPLDSNIGGDTPMGNGDWDAKFEAYWDINHGNRDGIANDSPPNGWSNSSLPSRYEVYRWEIDNGNIPDQSGASPEGEDGAPQCSNSAVSDEPDRRTIYAAVVDCAAYGDLVKGKATDIPALAFVKMFMTQPMNKKSECDKDDETNVDCNGTLFVEMMDVVSPGIDDEVVHDIVQLYR